MELTVANVAGLIAAGIVIVKLVLPELLAYIFLFTLREDQAQAATATATRWSVTSRFLHSSQWPFLLQSDSSASNHAGRSMLLFTYNQTFIALLISLAAIISPLGLYDTIIPGSVNSPVEFHHIRDPGIFGQATPPRNSFAKWSRICTTEDLPCPHSDSLTGFNSTNYNTTVPQRTVELFSSGTSRLGGSVSSVFDIQWRFVVHETTNLSYGPEILNNGAGIDVGYFRPIGSLIQNGKYEAIEGLVVDTINGGIGFRNHTAPPLTPYGARWSEDLLFLEPVTQCVDTNLSVQFDIPGDINLQSKGRFENVFLVDRGGFANADPTDPGLPLANDSQVNLDLKQRAYRAAWYHNILTMYFMNVTVFKKSSLQNYPNYEFLYLNSTIGKKFPLIGQNSSVPGIYFGASGYDHLLSGHNLPFTSDVPRSTPPLLYPNPFNISQDRFTKETSSLWGDYANITNIVMHCGLAWMPAYRKDGSSDPVITPESTWVQDLYSCGSTVRAIIKTVTFEFNKTDDLGGLSIIDIKNKVYENPSARPYWAIEDTESPVTDVLPLWGIVSPESVAGVSNISVSQQESLYLGGGIASTVTAGSVFDSKDEQNLPGVSIAGKLLFNIYSSGSLLPPPPLGGYDYSGRNSYIIQNRWEKLSRSPDSIPKILNLIWTDLAANALTGTKGRSLSNNINNDSTPIYFYQRKISYRLPYAIPAIIVLVYVFLTTIFAVYATTYGHASIQKMRRYLNATSAGRLMTTNTQESIRQVTNDMPTNVWIDLCGYTKITAGRGRIALSADDQAEGDEVENLAPQPKGGQQDPS
ncbi:hypothetical protein TWF281_004563 [Arthrobotrys megalospora]